MFSFAPPLHLSSSYASQPPSVPFPPDRIPAARCKPFFKISVGRISGSRNSVAGVNASANFHGRKKYLQIIHLALTGKTFVSDEPQSVIDADKSPTKICHLYRRLFFVRRRPMIVAAVIIGPDGRNWALRLSLGSAAGKFIDATYR